MPSATARRVYWSAHPHWRRISVACGSYIAKLVDQGVIERRADGRFDQDQCRAKYIAHLRAEHLRGDFPSLMAKMPFQSTPPRAGDQGMLARSEAPSVVT